MLRLSESFFDRVTPYVLALASLFSYLQILNFIRPEYLSMSHKIWTVELFAVDLPLFSPLLLLTLTTVGWVLWRRPRAIILIILGGLSFLLLDVGVALAVVSLISVIVALSLGCSIRDYCTGLLGVVLAVEAWSLLHWLVFLPTGLSDPLQVLTSLEQAHYYLFAQLSPGFMLAVVAAGIGLPLYHLSRRPVINELLNSDGSVKANRVWLVLGLTLLLSVVVAVYPYLPSINPGQLNPGVDINDYVASYGRLVADPSQIITEMGGSRPIFFLFVLAFQRVTSLDPLYAIRFLPVVLNPLICVSVFILTREVTRNSSAALYAAFFTASGFTLSVGMYAYFLADILMLSLFFLSLATLFAALRKMSRPYFLASVSLGSLAVFTHPWTFDQYFVAVVGGTFLLYIINFREEGSIRIKWLVVYCLILAGTDVFKFIIFRGSIEGFAALGLVSGFLTSVSTFRVDLVNVSMFYLNGYLTNMPLLTLAVLGFARAKARTVSNLIFWVLLVTTFSAYLIGDVIVKSRLLYNIPIGLFAALGLSYIDDLVLDKRLRTMIKAVVVVLLLSYLFRDLANLV